MKTILMFGSVLVSGFAASGQTPFRNLDFEAATFPGAPPDPMYGPAYAGQEAAIQFTASGHLYLDLIRFTATPVPEPSALALIGLAGAALASVGVWNRALRRRNRRRRRSRRAKLGA